MCRIVELDGTPRSIKHLVSSTNILEGTRPGTLATDVHQFEASANESPHQVEATGMRVKPLSTEIIAKLSTYLGVPIMRLPRIGTPLLSAWIKGLKYSQRTVSQGNSLVIVRNQANCPPVAACIEFMFQYTHREEGDLRVKTYILVRLFKRSSTKRSNPFDKYPYLKASFWSRTLSETTLVLNCDDIVCHFATCPWNDHELVVLPLIRVSFLYCVSFNIFTETASA
jgi:hypothetical protein